MKSSLLELFRLLTSVPTAPYCEQAVALKALEWSRRHLGPRVKIRRCLGGLVLSYRGAGKGQALALAAHLDHPAFRLSRVETPAALARLRGGLPRHLLEGCSVEAFPEKPKGNVPLARGVLGAARKDGDYPVRWLEAPRGRPAFAVLALTPCSLEGKWLLSRSIDDLLGCAISLEALRLVSSSRAKTNLSVLLHRAEEVGFVGALDLIRAGKVSLEDSIISVETSRELPGARPGKGPVIRLGDKACLFDPNLTALLDEAASRLRKRGLRTQRRRLTGGTCEATAYLAFGYEAGGVAVPLVNYHNGWGAKAVAPEKVRIDDAQACVSLLVEAARLFPGRTLRGALRRRLEQRHSESQVLLA